MSTAATTSEAATHPTASVETTASAPLHHHLHHREHLGHGVVLAAHAAVTHARLVLALLQDGDLSALEERLVVHLSLLDGFLGSELDVGVSIMFSRVNLPLGLVGHLLDRDGDTVDLSTVAEMLLEVFLGGAEVDILNEDGPLVRVVSPRRCWNRSRGTAGFMLIY